MRLNNNIRGHLSAIFTVILWGTTFISTKILLGSFTPIEILCYRFVIGFIALFILRPRGVKGKTFVQEAQFAAAGLCGVTLYFLMENIALTYTTASNVGVIVSISPFFTAVLSRLYFKDEKLTPGFFIGFVAAIIGILLISYNSTQSFGLNPLGDILAILAAAAWALYSNITKKISFYGYDTIYTTRKIFSYGIVFMIPAAIIMPFEFGFERLTDPVNLLNILYLGLGASALCFVIWNFALKVLGPVKTSVYIYLVPVITIVTSIIILDERITPVSLCGIVLTLAGLFVSERTSKGRSKETQTVQ